MQAVGFGPLGHVAMAKQNRALMIYNADGESIIREQQSIRRMWNVKVNWLKSR